MSTSSLDDENKVRSQLLLSTSASTVAAIKPVTALSSIPSVTGEPAFILSAQGFDLRVHNCKTRKVLLTTQIFKAQTIHGIKCTVQDWCERRKEDQQYHDLIIWGGCWVRYAILAISLQNELVSFELEDSSLECDDWILDVCIARGKRQAVAVTAHNDLIALPPTKQHKQRDRTGVQQPVVLGRGSRSILYSAHVVWKDDETLLVAGGTAFGQILLQTCSYRGSHESVEIVTHYVFSGHEGSIFGVKISEPLVQNDGTLRLLASCSDDRSVRIWNVSDLSPVVPAETAELDETGFLAAKTETCLAAAAVGHISRVWSLRYIYVSVDGASILRLVSAGEDATCRAWELRKISCDDSFVLQSTGVICAHSGKNVWAMEVVRPESHASHCAVVTGGADGGIIISSVLSSSTASSAETSSAWRLSEIMTQSHTDHLVIDRSKDCFRAMTLVQGGAILVASDRGHIFLSKPVADNVTNKINTIWSLIDTVPDLEGYSIATSTIDGNFSAIAGASGHVYCFDSSTRSLQQVFKGARKVSGLWLEKSCHGDEDGLDLIIAELGSGKITVIQMQKSGSVPLKVIDSMTFVIGSQVVTTATSYQTAKGIMIAVGSRNGTIKVFRYDKCHTMQDVVPELTQHTVVDNTGRESITQLKFSISKEQLYLLSAGRDGYLTMHITKQAPCESFLVHKLTMPFGPHIEGLWICPSTEAIIIYGFRSTDLIVYDLTEQREIATIHCGGAHRTFALQLRSVRTSIGEVVRICTFAWTQDHQLRWQQVNDTKMRVLQAGGHGRDIKACAISSGHFGRSMILDRLIATGAEDTDIRIFGRSELSFECIATLRKHTTGIRCLKWSSDGKKLFSSGGKEEFFVWRITEIPILQIGVVCEAVIPVEDGGSDLRIMSFDVRNQISQHDGEARFIITMAYSNSFIKTYEYVYDGAQSLWILLVSTQYTTACLTHVEYLESDRHECPAFFTASTDGNLVCWRQAQGNHSSARHQILCSKHLHQNAITACSSCRLDANKWLVVTGGDDNALCFSIIQGPDLSIASIHVRKAHGAAVTGVYLEGDGMDCVKVTTIGLDQRVKEWQYNSQMHSVKKISSKWTSIADPAGVNDVVFGVGMVNR